MPLSGVTTLTLSGWGQPHDALGELVPHAATLDYTGYSHVADALKAIADLGKDKDLVIGWSLGGQLAVRAIAAGLMRPKKLVLIAAPFQFVKRPEHPVGMPAELYDIFRENYAAYPDKTLIKAWASIVKGDKNASFIRKHLEKQDKAIILAQNWLHWLDILHHFSCKDLFMDNFPPTLLVHGREDAVVYYEQSQAFAHALPHATLITLEGCGHAPHWHAPEQVTQAIREFAHV